MSPTLYLLDGAQGLILIPFFFILHVVTTLLIEGTVLYNFRYKPFGKCLTDAFIVNICSLVVGLLLMWPFQAVADWLADYEGRLFLFYLLFLFFVQTVLVEGLILRQLNKTFPLRRLITAVIVMNVITYVTLYLVLTWIE